MIGALFILLAANSVCNYESDEEFLPAIISTPDAHEGLDWVSVDGNSVLFTRALPDFSISTIMHATKVDDDWIVENVPISSEGYDAGLSIAPSGVSALFTSTRRTGDGQVGGWNIWQLDATFNGHKWNFGDPRLMPEPVNSAHSECCVVHGDDQDFYFASNRLGSWDIFHAEPDQDGFQVSFLSGGVNSDEDAWPSAIIANPKKLLYSSISATGVGGDDIYVAYMQGADWSPGKLLGAGINRLGYEDSARVFGSAFFWSSRPKSGENTGDLSVSNIYTMPTTCIDELG